jgi:hypothetical protein
VCSWNRARKRVTIEVSELEIVRWGYRSDNPWTEVRTTEFSFYSGRTVDISDDDKIVDLQRLLISLDIGMGDATVLPELIVFS